MVKTILIQVKVTGVSSLRSIMSKDTPVILKSGSTVSDLIDKLEEELGSTYRKATGEGLEDTIRRLFNVSINGKLAAPGRNFDEILNDGDEILFFQWTGA